MASEAESFLTGYGLPLGCSSPNNDISEVGSPLTYHGVDVALHHSHNRSVTIRIVTTTLEGRPSYLLILIPQELLP